MEEALYYSSLFFELTETDRQESVICKFRYLLEKHQLNERFFEKVNHILEEKKLMLREGTIADTTIIPARIRPKRREKT